MTRLDRLLSLADFEEAARRRLPSAVYEFVRGGAEDEQSLRANLEAFHRIAFRPRGLAGIARRSQETELFGRTWAAPFGVAPMSATALCRHECDLALARGAASRGIPFVLSGLSTVPLEQVRRRARDIWYQADLPGDPDQIGLLMDRLAAAEIDVLVVTIDACVEGNHENSRRAGFTMPFRPSLRLALDGLRHPAWSARTFGRAMLRGVPRFANVSADPRGHRITTQPDGGIRQGRERLSWQHLRWMRSRWGGKLLIKGVLHPQDARLAVEQGLDGVIVSNHGGRQLDGTLAPLRALPDVIRTVPSSYPVMIDGGFRRGSDVLKAIALGARLAFIGRPMLYGATIAGAAGVQRVIDILMTEIDRNLALLGCAASSDLDRSVLALER